MEEKFLFTEACVRLICGPFNTGFTVGLRKVFRCREPSTISAPLNILYY